ncbi:MAG: OmpA family protein [Pseudomonadales bacterium]
MKKTILMCAILGLGSVTAATASADSFELSDESKRNGVIWGSIVTGAVAAGPLGALAGTIAGSWLGEKVETAGQLEETEQALAEAHAQAEELSKQLAGTTKPVSQPINLEGLQLELLFKTGERRLNESGTEKISELAKLMKQHPELQVYLEGHTDPRGNTDYNQALSENRLQTVAGILQDKGIDSRRIRSHAFGASQSSATKGDYDSYALERVVKIQLSRQPAPENYARNH